MNNRRSIEPGKMQAACEMQRLMASKVISYDDFGPLRTIGGMDVSCTRFDPEKKIYGAVVALSCDTRKVLECANALSVQDFPYIPGFLAFREAPVLVEAYKKLAQKPDLIMVDGQGICHPRGLGIASHIGVELDIPTIGVAKTLLLGAPRGVLTAVRGSKVALEYNGKRVAMLLRSKKNAKALIISIGHRISLDTALDLVESMLAGYRLPEPTRLAHIAANAFRRSFQG